MRRPSLRGTAFYFFFAFALLLSVISAAVLAFLCFSTRAREVLEKLPFHRFWFSYPAASPKESIACFWVLGAVVIISLFAAFSVLRARSMYMRSPVPALLYFIVYIFSVCMESLRGPAIWLYAAGRAIPLIAPISRAVYASRFAGQLALLLTALAMLDMKYQKRLVLLGLLFLVSFAFAISIPMDNTTFLSSFTFKLGDEQGVGFADLALGVLTAAGMAAAGYVRKQGRFYLMAGASVLLFVGRQIISFTVPPVLLAAGPVLIAAGIVVFLMELGRVYGEPQSG